MTIPYLRELDYNATILPSYARQDKIEISLDGWQLSCNSETIESLKRQLHEYIYVGSTSRNHAQVLKAADVYRGLGWDVRGGDGSNISRVDTPLFTGRLKCLNPPWSSSNRPTNFFASLRVNPTRFAAQQFGLYRNTPAPAFFKLSNSLDGLNEEVLSPCDNVLMGCSRHLARFRPDVWLDRSQDYIDGIWSILNELMLDASESVSPGIDCSDILRHPVPLVRIWKIETYWEFQSPDPIREMYRICKLAERTPYDSRRRYFENLSESPSLDHVANSPCLNINHNGAQIRIYAKTNKRIRFEVAFGKKKVARLMSAHRRQFPIHDFKTILHGFAEAAADDLQDIFNSIRSGATNANTKDILDLVDEVYSAAGNQSLAKSILRLLGHRGCVAMASNTNMGDAIKRLRRRQVLCRPVRNGRRTTYALAPNYATVASQLRDLFPAEDCLRTPQN